MIANIIKFINRSIKFLNELIRKSVNKIYKLILGIPIGLKISLIMILSLSITVIIISSILFNQEKKLLLEEIKSRGALLSENLAQAGFEAVVNKNKLFSGDVINKIIKEKGVVYALILDKRERIVDSSIKDEEVPDIHDLYMAEFGKQIKQIKDIGYFDFNFKKKKIIDVVRPIILEYKRKKNRLGFVRVGISKEIIDSEIRKAQYYAFGLALGFIILGIFLSFYFARSITRPILMIVKVMNDVAKGDLSNKVEISLTDEIGKLAASFNDMIVHLREKLMMSKYVSKSTREMITEAGEEDESLSLGGEQKKATLLFSDIRGFTSFSANRTPEQVIAMLNKYLSIQAEIISSNQGSIDKFVGDEVVALFEGDKDVENAIRSAIQIQKQVGALNESREEKIYVGIGINTGEVIMGNVGSENRMDYTAIGDNVNVAARLCDSAHQEQIIVSDSTYNIGNYAFKFSEPFEIQVKGKKEALKVYAVIY